MQKMNVSEVVLLLRLFQMRERGLVSCRISCGNKLKAAGYAFFNEEDRIIITEDGEKRAKRILAGKDEPLV